MQQAELCEILPELKQRTECYQLFGTAMPNGEQLRKYEQIQAIRQENLNLKAEQERKREYWNRVQEARCHNLKLLAIARQQKQEQREIQLLELVKRNKDVLSSVR